MNIFLKSTTVALLAIPFAANATEITNTEITSTGVKVVVDLDSNLKKGEKVKIDYGKGLKTMRCKNKSCSITFTATAALPKNATKLDYKIGIYNGNTLLNSTLKNGTVNFSLSEVSAAVDNNTSQTTSVETVSTPYSKIANDGSLLPDSAQLGTKPTDWACTKDNKTGLIWEVKTSDGGLRDKNNTYSWYYANEGTPGTQNGGLCMGSNCDTSSYADAVNLKNLCGATNWKLPTNANLVSLVGCPDDKMTTTLTDENRLICISNLAAPTMDKFYFPDIDNKAVFYWSSETIFGLDGWYAKGIDFNNFALNDGQSKSCGSPVMICNAHIRLVRNAQ